MLLRSKKVISRFPSNLESVAKLEVLKILSSRTFIFFLNLPPKKNLNVVPFILTIGSIERALSQRRHYFGTAQRLVCALVRLVFLTIREEESHAPSKREINKPYISFPSKIKQAVFD